MLRSASVAQRRDPDDRHSIELSRHRRGCAGLSARRSRGLSAASSGSAGRGLANRPQSDGRLAAAADRDRRPACRDQVYELRFRCLGALWPRRRRCRVACRDHQCDPLFRHSKRRDRRYLRHSLSRRDSLPLIPHGDLERCKRDRGPAGDEAPLASAERQLRVECGPQSRQGGRRPAIRAHRDLAGHDLPVPDAVRRPIGPS